MSNADRIRAMDDEELAFFIFKWQVNVIAEVFKNGFVNTLNAVEMVEWLKEPGAAHPIFEKWEENEGGGAR